MKKGNTWPRTRARWIAGAVVEGVEQPPSFAGIRSLACTVVVEVLGIPFPLFINQNDCSYGKWSYRPSASEVVWRGDWRIGDNNGPWEFAQSTGDDEWTRRRFSIGWDSGVGIAWNIHKNHATGDHGNWQYGVLSTVGAPDLVSFDLPWFPYVSVLMEPLTYHDLRAAGDDPDDTAPETWNLPPF
jgi:hypothetical protein